MSTILLGSLKMLEQPYHIPGGVVMNIATKLGFTTQSLLFRPWKLKQFVRNGRTYFYPNWTGKLLSFTGKGFEIALPVAESYTTERRLTYAKGALNIIDSFDYRKYVVYLRSKLSKANARQMETELTAQINTWIPSFNVPLSIEGLGTIQYKDYYDYYNFPGEYSLGNIVYLPSEAGNIDFRKELKGFDLCSEVPSSSTRFLI
ncbi:hypothetical protein KAZ57_01515 [Patescibacteria group bacterium]|nr:hypothetical protein [Patescibacteria group bacterium]